MIKERRTKVSRIANQYREELLARRLEAGSPVDSVRDLADKYRISRVTADRVLNLLADEELIYRVPRSGSYLKNDPPPVPRIGIVNDHPLTGGIALHRTVWAEKIARVLADRNISASYIPYHVLCDPAAAEKAFSRLNGLLVSTWFADRKAAVALRAFKGKIVVFGTLYPLDEEFACSQVMTDFRSALDEMADQVDWSKYEHFLILVPGNRNSLATEQVVRRFFRDITIPEAKIESVDFGDVRSEFAAIAATNYFVNAGRDFSRTLIVTLSDYFAFGIAGLLGGNPPDVLSFDNFEGSMPNAPVEGYFTSADRMIDRVIETSVSLLTRQIVEADDCRVIVQIPSHIVFRKSLRPKPEILKEKNHVVQN